MSAASSSHPVNTSKTNLLNDLFPTTSYAPATASSVFRRVLRQSFAAICFINGFDAAEASVLERMTHLMNTYMNALCASAKLNCEVAGRTVAIPTDVWLALINMGQDVSSLPTFLQSVSTGTLVIPPPKVQAAPSQSGALRVGRSRPHPQHINAFMPPFPDPHTYIRTEISGEPDTSYEKVREMAAQRKRDTEQSLVDFMLRVHPRTSLFHDFEERVKEEASRAIMDRERQKEARRMARRQAKAAERAKTGTTDGSMPDELFEDDILDKPNESNPSGALSDSEDEMEFELEETETSLVLRRLPTYCAVLDPSLESRPYLSALVSDELQDDLGNETASGAQQSTSATNQSTEEQTYDNAYLRPARMPSKDAFMEY